MSVFTSGYDFVSLYGIDGLGLLVGIRDSTTDAAGRKNAVNWSYVDLASIKGYWRSRSYDYTASSSPALTDGTRAYNVPSDYDAPFRVYYRENGRVQDIEIVSDSRWLELSATRTADAGYPEHARMIHNGTTFRIEFDKPISQAFITAIGTVTFEYFATITQLSSDTDTPVLPVNLRPLILPGATWYYATAQGDNTLADRMKPEMTLARARVLKYDLTRTGRPRQLRPTSAYESRGVTSANDYGAIS